MLSVVWAEELSLWQVANHSRIGEGRVVIPGMIAFLDYGATGAFDLVVENTMYYH